MIRGMRSITGSWAIDEVEHAGAQHVDPGYVADYGRKAGFDPTEDIASLRGCGLGPRSTVVDIGCGVGTFALAVAPYCRRAIAVSSNFAGAHHNLALILKEKGRLDEAIRAEKRAIRLTPRNTSYYEHLGVLRPFAAGDRYIRALEDMAADGASLSATERVHLHFALAKAYDDTGRFENAFMQLSAGNRLMRLQTAYDEAAALGRMDSTCQLFTPDFIKGHQGMGDPSPLPVFIVGMPRSGTTLIEQILASHPEVFGAGELNLLDRSAGAVGHALAGAPRFPAMAADMSTAHFHALGTSYREALAQRAPNASRIVDKMPGNFLFAGLIHLALPNATIIHAVRDPIDTCVSCFSTLFTNQAHTYDLAELGYYYRHYQTLMTHWRRVLPPGRIVDVHYEDLVGDLESGARRIIAHCGLPWDRHCLDFHRTERTVRTASAAQVRRPIYRTSVRRWEQRTPCGSGQRLRWGRPRPAGWGSRRATGSPGAAPGAPRGAKLRCG